MQLHLQPQSSHPSSATSRTEKLRAAIDGKILLEIDDSSHTNTGAILNYGHIALRCMVHTKMVFRKLKVYTEQLPFTEVKFANELQVGRTKEYFPLALITSFFVLFHPITHEDQTTSVE